MQFKIEDIRLSTITLTGPHGIHVLFPTDLLTDIDITKDKMQIGGIITMHISYGCCRLYVKYESTLNSFVNEIEFCPFCGTKVNEIPSSSKEA